MKGKEYLIEGYDLYPPRVQGMLLLKKAWEDRFEVARREHDYDRGDVWMDGFDTAKERAEEGVNRLLDDLIREYSVEDE